MIIQGKIPGTFEVVSFIIEEKTIVRIELCKKGAECDFGGRDFYLSPGFFDPQVNGFAGVDFNNKSLTPEGLHQAAHSLATFGVTRFLPTLITAPHERMAQQLKIIATAIENDPFLRRMCPGIHLEGPYISPEDGPRGVHPSEFVRSPRWEELKRFQEVCRGKIRCITLAPEVEGAIRFIERSVRDGMVVGLGHTDASETVIEDAVRAGARLSCHLGNGTRPLLPPHRNPIQKQLAMDQLMATIITDGIHLPPYVVRNFVRSKGMDRMMLTTDCVAGAGASPGRYTLGELEVEVRDDWVARLPNSLRLAGSALTMDRAITNLIRFAEVDLASAMKMATGNAGKLFTEVSGEIAPGYSGDWVLFEYQNELNIRSTWIDGEKIF
jgi:N-acetylglucosamine-6-phosphate deacetylase